ncbi:MULTISPECIES: DUF4429 domain-containing protein [Streptomyces]|uniref:DUF4429 domain-containing protein n=1 Tax=Streptomyces cremeus TaxID=66881 RepID=A0ABV5PHA6_STRCM
MAEIFSKDGTWTFDGDAVRIEPSGDKGVGLLRRTLGEVVVPLEALAGASFEPGRKTGRLKLRMREGACALTQITGGRLDDVSNPYLLTVGKDLQGAAEYFVDAVRNALLLEQVDKGPVDHYLLRGPHVPLTVGAGDGVLTFDGETVRLEWNWKTDEAKSSGGPQTIALKDVLAVEWLPAMGLEEGYLRFRTAQSPPALRASLDRFAVEVYGFKKDPLMALAAAAVAARMPHPHAAEDTAPEAPAALEAAARDAAPAAEDHDVLLRRLRELGELHRSGILTEEEFTLAKQAVLKRL